MQYVIEMSSQVKISSSCAKPKTQILSRLGPCELIAHSHQIKSRPNAVELKQAPLYFFLQFTKQLLALRRCEQETFSATGYNYSYTAPSSSPQSLPARNP